MLTSSKKIFFLIFLLLQTSNASSSNLLSNDLSQFFGDFLVPGSAQKMKETSRQWSSVKIYEHIFPNESDVAVLRKLNTEELFWVGQTMPNQEKLVSHLRQNDSAKWNDVLLWFAKNWYKLGNESTNQVFLKALMLAIAENIAVKFTDRYEWTPLMLAARIDDKDSILTLIKRGANVNQQDSYGGTALHEAAWYGNIDACATLLNNDANINSTKHIGMTPLMIAAYNRKKNVYQFLIKKGADETRTDNFGKTASQLAYFVQK